MPQFKHSCVLFVDPLGDPLEFYMRPCPSRFNVMQMVRHGGGIFCSNGGAGIRRLVEPGTKVIHLFDGEVVLSVQYIYDCVEKNILLDPEPYTIQVNQLDISDISDDDSNVPTFRSSPAKSSNTLTKVEEEKVIDYLIGNSEDFLRLSLNKFCIRVANTRIVDKSASVISDYLSRLAQSSKSSGLATKKENNFRKLWNSKLKAPFSNDDDLNMLNYIIDNNLCHRVQELSLFTEMYRAKVTFHGASAMQQRFKQKILPNIGIFDISEEARSQILKHSGKLGKPPRKIGICKTVKQTTKRPLSEIEFSKTSSNSSTSKLSLKRNKKVKLDGKSDKLDGDTQTLSSSMVNKSSTKYTVINSIKEVSAKPHVSSAGIHLKNSSDKLCNNKIKKVTKESAQKKNFVQSPESTLKIGNVFTMNSSAANRIQSKEEFLSIMESSKRSASPVLSKPGASKITKGPKSKKITDWLESSNPLEETERTSEQESPSLVTTDDKVKRVSLKLYDPELCTLSLPDFDDDDSSLIKEVTTVCQNITSQIQSKDCSFDTSHTSSKPPVNTMEDDDICLVAETNSSDNKQVDVTEEVPEPISRTRESTPDLLDDYDISMLNKLKGLNSAPNMNENVSHYEAEIEDAVRNFAVDHHPIKEEPGSPPCEMVMCIENHPNEIPESVMGTVDENEQKEPSECGASYQSQGIEDAVDEDQQSELKEADIYHQNEETRSGKVVFNRKRIGILHSDDDEEENHEIPLRSCQSNNDKVRHKETVDDDKIAASSPECSTSTSGEQSKNDTALESLFMSEATVITYKLEKCVAGMRNSEKKKELQKDIDKLKGRMYKQFLEIHVRQIMKKPVLSLEDKALLTKYLALLHETTPEDILLNKCGML